MEFHIMALQRTGFARFSVSIFQRIRVSAFRDLTMFACYALHREPPV